jgi:D-alanine-D-alanine ligase
MKIGILVGGPSNESEISYLSGNNVLNSLKRLGYSSFLMDPRDKDFIEKIDLCDLVFNLIHGAIGEDGKIQGLLDLKGKKYTCSGVSVCSSTYDKYVFHNLFKDVIKCPETYLAKDLISEPFDYPFVIKPRSSGSSKGVHIIHSHMQYLQAMEQELKIYGQMLIQQYIKAREITVSVLQNRSDYEILPILELRPKNEFYDYEAKYTDGMTEFIVPANLNSTEMESIEKACKTITSVLDLKDMFRIDGLIWKNSFYVLEVNTVPGMTNLSDLPQSAYAKGMTFDQIVDTIIKNHI